MNKFNEIRNDLHCEYCNKQCKNLNSLKNHECRCKSNPNRLENVGNPDNIHKYLEKLHSGEIEVWNKGLTKETDERLAKCGKKLSYIMKNKHIQLREQGRVPGTAFTEEKELERRVKISNTMMSNPNAGGLRPKSGRGKKGWYKGYFCDSTYELVYVIYNIDHDIKFRRCGKHYEYFYLGEKHRYYPDFELEDGTLVEIKGFKNGQTFAKLKSVYDVDIILLTEDKLSYAFDYVKSKYEYESLEDLYEDGEL